MCYYDVLVFTCGDYRWDKFRGRCPREHRMGETCGTKMLYSQIASASKCKFCQKIDVKLRKRQFELNRYNRWVQEGSKLRASMELSLQTIAELDAEIQRLTAQRQPFRPR